MIFNLTEKHYDPGKFRNRVLRSTHARTGARVRMCCVKTLRTHRCGSTGGPITIPHR